MLAAEDGGIQARLVNFYVNMLPVARHLPVDE
jgi:hypothetical protein